MKSSIAAFVMLIVLTLSPSLFASGKKETKLSVSFHLQTEATDNPKMIFPQLTNGKTLFFRRMPEFSTKDIEAFVPFPADVGDEYGVAFKLKESAATRLSAITNTNVDRWLVAQVNGRVLDAVMIDKEVDDGFLVIWKGVTAEDLKVLDKGMKRLGGEKKPKNKR
jgi:hypothetical protein